MVAHGFTQTPVNPGITMRLVKKENFSEAQNAALRDFLRSYRDERGLSQGEIATLMGVSQQTASSFLSGKTGVAYAAGSRIAMLAQATGVDEFFRSKGLLPWYLEKGEKDPFSERAQASQLARLRGLSEEAITAARAMSGTGLETRKVWWWGTEIQRFHDDLLNSRRDIEHHTKEHAKKKKSSKKQSAA